MERAGSAVKIGRRIAVTTVKKYVPPGMNNLRYADMIDPPTT
jgi:hypothetical protein